jgi:hypothetical protein
VVGLAPAYVCIHTIMVTLYMSCRCKLGVSFVHNEKVIGKWELSSLFLSKEASILPLLKGLKEVQLGVSESRAALFFYEYISLGTNYKPASLSRVIKSKLLVYPNFSFPARVY